ncbi:hypothetical protein HMPREF0548_0428 [Lactobacillus ultunensis DSM 16047]|uniref:Uncharacterized protein n=1 Tax=Lactobacillus ultunensis DSM 16047 TaxID=525365 RepID=C2EL82_9LACO|nr:hypothetical protein HMPREF0548_0428 [Lactobacillus ultunensis DSM 16047]
MRIGLGSKKVNIESLTNKRMGTCKTFMGGYTKVDYLISTKVFYCL